MLYKGNSQVIQFIENKLLNIFGFLILSLIDSRVDWFKKFNYITFINYSIGYKR